MSVASGFASYSGFGPLYDPSTAAAKNGDHRGPGLSRFDRSFSSDVPSSSSAAATATAGAVSSSAEAAVKANFHTEGEEGSGNGNDQPTKKGCPASGNT